LLIAEPVGGAHRDPDAAIQRVGEALELALLEFDSIDGADIRKLKLYGEPMGQQAFDLAHDAPAGSLATIAYKLPKPGTNTPSPKEALQTRVGDQACGVAYFK